MSGSYDFYDYGYTANEEVFNVAMMVVGFLMIFLLIGMVVGLILYIFRASGLYTIAKRRGIRHAWLAWVPVGFYWLTGCIADQYRYVVRGEVKNRRTIMLVLSLITSVVSSVCLCVSGAGMIGMLSQLETSGTQAMEGLALGGSYGMSALLSLLGSAASMTLLVFWYISLYDLYTSCNPKNSVVFLVLGIFLPFLNSIFTFAVRSKDDGMPPRKQPADIPDPKWQPSEPPKEPWENSEE